MGPGLEGNDMATDVGLRCRRCGAEVSGDAERYVHVLPVEGEPGGRAVQLVMCLPCGAGFASLRERDEYARLVYFG
jgi:DNA-directed RNA polymerase subunit RPC12/RpoP